MVIAFNHNGYRYTLNIKTRTFFIQDNNILGKLRDNVPVPTQQHLESFFDGVEVLHENDAAEILKNKCSQFEKLLNYLDYWRRTEGKIIIFAQVICKQTKKTTLNNSIDLINYTYGDQGEIQQLDTIGKNLNTG